MTSYTKIVNRGLQVIGTRTTVTDAELAGSTSNEAIQANLVLYEYRDQLLRMAPWDCGLKTGNLTYITSVPGTPENTSPQTSLWTPGQPAPPWAYEYQYPVDCLRACWVIPATQTGYAGGIPITTAVTGGASVALTPPIRFKVQVDEFYPVTGAAVVAGGAGYAVGDIITLPLGLTTSPPIGAPAQLVVLTAPGGVIATMGVVNQILGEDSAAPLGGSYFAVQANPVAQSSTSGGGSGATFNLTFGAKGSQRVILTNQEFATLSYVKQVLDPNVFDSLFIEAYARVLGAGLCMALTGDKQLANAKIGEANSFIAEARKVDGNEGLTVNNVTPDFIRIRGVDFTEYLSGPYSGFDWGDSWPTY